jgi:catechol 2,3-dioxygenase-like lactoylglutathione lyase family enzyme
VDLESFHLVHLVGGGGTMVAMIGRLYNVVIDCPDPKALAHFYAELLGMGVVTDRGDWLVIESAAGRPGIAFQYAPDHKPPRWPDPEFPQQLHLDVNVDDVDIAEQQVLALGATRLPGQGEDFRVYADPAGHPFCLVWDA